MNQTFMPLGYSVGQKKRKKYLRKQQQLGRYLVRTMYSLSSIVYVTSESEGEASSENR